MRIANNLPQNSAEWLKWRQSGLGASDAPTVMGVSPFTTRYELWLEKTGKASRPPFHPNAVKAMARGTLLEPEARKCYEDMVGSTFEVMNVIHQLYYFIRASLDGCNRTLNRIVEIKCPGKLDLAVASKGRVPAKYAPQVQLQLLVTGAVACDYFTYAGKDTGYFDGKDGKIIEVLPDKEYQAKLEAEMIAFWELVQKKVPPLLTIKDLVRSSKALENAVEKLAEAEYVNRLAIETFSEQE